MRAWCCVSMMRSEGGMEVKIQDVARRESDGRAGASKRAKSTKTTQLDARSHGPWSMACSSLKSSAPLHDKRKMKA